MKPKTNNIVKDVMDAIHEERLKIKPKIYFILGSALLFLGIIINLTLAIFFFAQVVFRMRLHAPFSYLHYGQLGLSPFFATFPWFCFILGALACIGGILLLRKYDISYKKNFLYIIIWLLIIIMACGFLLDQIGLNERVDNIGVLKPLAPIYYLGDSWLVGEVADQTESTLTVIMPNGRSIKVVWSKETKLPDGQNFSLGDKVRIIGRWLENDFEARVIDRHHAGWRKNIYYEMMLQKKPVPPGL